VGALGWARRVIADKGEVDPIPVRVEDGPDGCFLRAGVNGGAARIAVHRRPNPAPHPILKEIHSCEVAGRRLEAESPDALRRKVAAMLEGIAPARSLPLAYFRAPAAGYELPVYEDDGEIVAHAFGGPRSRARDLAGVRAHVARHLVTAGYVAAEDDLEVGLVDQSDLSLLEPPAVLRSLDDVDVWIPWVDRGAAAGPRIDELGLDAPADGNDVLSIVYLASRALDRTLYASAVAPDAWRAAAARLTPGGSALVADLDDGDATTRLELPVGGTARGQVAVGLDCGRIDAFLAASADELAEQVARRLERLGFATRVVVAAAS
jgi:hypothetical protein